MAYILENHKSINLLLDCVNHSDVFFAYSYTTESEAFLRDFLLVNDVLDPYGNGSSSDYTEILCNLHNHHQAWLEAIAAFDPYCEDLLDLKTRRAGLFAASSV